MQSSQCAERNVLPIRAAFVQNMSGGSSELGGGYREALEKEGGPAGLPL